MEILKTKEETTKLVLNDSVLPCLQKYTKERLFALCSGIDYDQFNKKLTITFYNFSNSQGVYEGYKSLLMISDYYLNNPDQVVSIIINHYTLNEDKTEDVAYDSVSYSGKIDRTVPFLIEPEDPKSINQEVKFMRLVLSDVETSVALFPLKQIPLMIRVKTWFNAAIAQIKVKYRKIFPKPDPLKQKLPETSFISVYTKHELENRIFDTDVANKILETDLKDIPDPVEPDSKSRYENMMKKIRDKKVIYFP